MQVSESNTLHLFCLRVYTHTHTLLSAVILMSIELTAGSMSVATLDPNQLAPDPCHRESKTEKVKTQKNRNAKR